MEQMRITEFEVEQRKALFSFSQNDVQSLVSYKHLVEESIDELVEAFYRIKTSNAKLALLIGDADTLKWQTQSLILNAASIAITQHMSAPRNAFTLNLSHVPARRFCRKNTLYKGKS